MISTLPVRIEFIEAQTKVEALLPELFELVTDGMIEAQEATVLKWRAAQFPNAKGGDNGSYGAVQRIYLLPAFFLARCRRLTEAVPRKT